MRETSKEDMEKEVKENIERKNQLASDIIGFLNAENKHGYISAVQIHTAGSQ